MSLSHSSRKALADLGAQRVAGAELQVVHIAAKLVQAAHRLAAQHAAQG